MSTGKSVRELMVDVFEFPHIPYWFTIRQAIGIVKKSLIGSEKCHQPMAVLVFDEKYNLLGTVGLKELLRGLEPRFLKATTAKAQVLPEDESGLALVWDTLFDSKTREMAERPLSEVMVPAKVFVRPDDPVTKAAYLMVHNDLALLPVLDGKKFVGVVRLVEVFSALSEAL